MPKFIKGIKLNQLFYEQVVKPVINKRFQQLKYSAALIGHGSEVLGYDDITSTDHSWGTRLLLFLSEKDYRKYNKTIHKTLQEELPYKFLGWPTNYKRFDKNTWLLQNISKGKVNHRIEIYTIKSYFEDLLHVGTDAIKTSEWLTFSEQRLLAITKGKIYHDDLNLAKVRAKFSYYPMDIWLYLLSAQWMKISQEEAFVGRSGEVGDELGSRIVASRIIREIMRLCFLMEKKYAPYTKWFGTAFSELDCASRFNPILLRILVSTSWKERERGLSEAYTILADMHNKLEITRPMKTEVSKFHSRKFFVIHSDAFAKEILSSIKNREIRQVRQYIGSVNQFVDSTNVLDSAELTKKLQIVYR